ncbi:MAG TPA: BON domain-containing protein [Steroidobacteraceae bacterium]
MNQPGKFFGLALGIFLAHTLAGCAVYEKCGFQGCPGDAELSAKVQALILQHPALQPPNLIYVQTLDHVVYLSGMVDTSTERLLAQSVAQAAPGVKRVVNSIAESNAPGL